MTLVGVKGNGLTALSSEGLYVYTEELQYRLQQHGLPMLSPMMPPFCMAGFHSRYKENGMFSMSRER